MAEIVIVQSIKSVWTKKSRGGKLAGLRNAVAESFTIPLQNLTSNESFIFHAIVYDESNNFVSPVINSVGVIEGARLETGCVRVEQASGRVLVSYEYSGARCGAPERAKWPGASVGQSFELLPNECGRVVYNGRFSGNHWWYEKRVMNVGRFAQPLEQSFTRSRPAHLIDDTATLW
ncbi:MAG: hypothetical protein QOF02_2123 [Blastocatellia bacterium]|jgi:hypothetical protein|nr:hypothetical protein [Blastocatellia bacterium]